MIVVNLWAGPSAGKSTGASYVFSQLKMKGISCELITEYAKDLAWEERLPPHPTDYWYITAQQAHRLWRVKDKVDFAIVDSPLPLGIIYADKDLSYASYIWSLWDQYTNINFFVIRTKQYRQEGRHINETSAKRVDTLIKKMLKTHKMSYMEVFGDKSGYEGIVKNLLVDT